jgi:hypothetical protein
MIVLPKFTRSNAITIEDKLNAFFKFVNDLEIEHKDVVMKMFVKTLEGDVLAWYKAFPTGSINGWDLLSPTFRDN